MNRRSVYHWRGGRYHKLDYWTTPVAFKLEIEQDIAKGMSLFELMKKWIPKIETAKLSCPKPEAR